MTTSKIEAILDHTFETRYLLRRFTNDVILMPEQTSWAFPKHGFCSVVIVEALNNFVTMSRIFIVSDTIDVSTVYT